MAPASRGKDAGAKGVCLSQCINNAPSFAFVPERALLQTRPRDRMGEEFPDARRTDVAAPGQPDGPARREERCVCVHVTRRRLYWTARRMDGILEHAESCGSADPGSAAPCTRATFALLFHGAA